MSSLDVFFSEYVEGSGNNKALEIYNGTTAPINLGASNYVVQTYFNGETVPGEETFVLTGTVAAGDVYVLALNNGTLQPIIAQADQTTTDQFAWYNGNDSIVLRKGGPTGQVVDSIGQIGVDPGTEWGTGLISTAANTLRRNRNVTDGDPNPNDTFNPSLQWQGFSQNTVGDLGSHYAAPVLNNSAFPTLTAINEDTPAASNTGTPISTLISGLVTDINSDPQSIAVTGADNSNGTWQYSLNGGNSWTPFAAVSDTNATLLGSTSLYAGQLGTPPAIQPWMTLGNVNPDNPNPFGGLLATQTLNGGSTTLNSLANPSIYAGYSTHTAVPVVSVLPPALISVTFSPKNAAVPVLDRTLGYRVRFDVKINSEDHSPDDSDKNEDDLSDRAGFSLVAISSDGQKGVEIGFWDNEIWVQKDGISDSGPLFTHDTANPSGDRWFEDTTQLNSYELAVLGDNFTLFRNGNAILNNRPLRNYTSFAGQINPYKTPNFLFLGDDTTSASASFELKNVAVKTAEPRVRFVPNPDYFGTSPSLTFRAWDTSDNIASGTTGVNVSVNGSTSPFSRESETATITVNPVNDVPSFIKGVDRTVSHKAGPQTSAGWATAISPGPANESAQTVSFQVVGNDNTALFSVPPAIDSLGQLTFTPAGGATGTANIILNLKDSGGTANGGVDTSANQTFVINITNSVPNAISDNYKTLHDKVLNVPVAEGVLANDSDFDNDLLTATKVKNPNNGTLGFNKDGSFIYTPNPGFLGVDSFTYTVSDGIATSPEISANINVINNPPTAQPDTYTISAGKALSVIVPGVLGNDSDPDLDTLTAAVAANPTKGSIALNKDGSFIYTPNAGFFGTDTFTYTVSDGIVNSAPATVTVNVNNNPPTANSDSYTTAFNTGLNVTGFGVLINDTDLDNDPLTAILVTNPATGSIALNANGSFVYTPNAGFAGTDSFTYKANDGKADSAIVTASIIVNNPPTPPTTPTPTPTPTPTETPTPTPTETPDDGECICEQITLPAIGLIPGPNLVDRTWDRTFNGTDGDDFLIGSNLNDAISGFNGDDILLGQKGNDNIYGGLPSNIPLGPNADKDMLFGGNGNDYLNGAGGDDRLFGSKGDDVAIGGKDDDLIWGDKGNDTLVGAQGNDCLFGGSFDPYSPDSTGRDLLFGGAGNDLLNGGDAADTLSGGEGNDTVYGGKGNDVVVGGTGNDLLLGHRGSDSICGNDGDDTIFGDRAIDFNGEPDSLCGGAGNDLMFGNRGSDKLCGEEGNDTLYGGKGDDYLIGGLGNDFLSGGMGRDRFVLKAGEDPDQITDFTKGEDLLVLASGLTFAQLSITQNANAAFIRIGENGQLLAALDGVPANAIDLNDFTILG